MADLMESGRSLLLAVDMQVRLAAAIEGRESVIARASLLLEAAKRLKVPVVFTQQYPQGIGEVLPELTALAPGARSVDKLHFCSAKEAGLSQAIEELGRDQIVVMGMEAHICVLQTAIGLVGGNVQVYAVADAVGSRKHENARLGLDRMARAGIEIVSSEMVVYEWLERAATDEFRDLLPLIKA